MIVLRGLAIIIGLGAIAAVTHGTVLATGGYGWNTPASFYIALGCVQAGLAMALGAGMVRGILPKFAAVLLLVMCEAANFLATVDLQLTAAEDAAAPIHDAAAKRASAEAWVARARSRRPCAARGGDGGQGPGPMPWPRARRRGAPRIVALFLKLRCVRRRPPSTKRGSRYNLNSARRAPRSRGPTCRPQQRR